MSYFFYTFFALIYFAIFICAANLITGDVVNTYSVFAFFNFTSFLVALSGIIEYTHISFNTLVVLILDSLLILFGGVLATALPFYKHYQKNSSHLDTKEYLKFVDITSLLGILGIVLLFLNFLKSFSIGYLLHTPAILQKNFQTVSGIGYLNTLNILVIPEIVYIFKKKKIWLRRFIIYIFSSLGGLILAGNKSYIIIAILCGVYVYILNEKNKAKIIKYGINTGVIVFIIFYLYEKIIDIGVLQTNGFVIGFFSYFSGGWPALSKLISMDIQHTHGHYTFYLLKKAICKLTGKSFSNNYLPFVKIPFLYNVYTGNGDLFYDFGWAGIIIGYTTIGFICERFRKLYKRRGDGVAYQLLFAFLMSVLSITFFANYFIQPFVVVNVLYLIFYYVLVRLRIKIKIHK